jgi:hypothetical protein
MQLARFRRLDAIFIRKGNVFEPTELARGPWDPDAQHGGAPAALIAGELERVGSDRPFARIGIHFLKPVPLTPLSVTTSVEREGRIARRLRAEIRAGDDTVCFAYALQLARGNADVPGVPLEGARLAAPETGEAPPRLLPGPTFAADGIEIRFVRGRLLEPGPAQAWFRLRVPIVEGEETTQLQRAMAAADFGNGAGSALPWDEFTFVNPELTVYLLREPAGEWVGIDAVSSIDPGGIGLAESALHDEQGPVGRALQSLYVSRR